MGKIIHLKGYDGNVEKVFKIVKAIFPTTDKKVYVTLGLKGNFNIIDKEFTYEKGR